MSHPVPWCQLLADPTRRQLFDIYNRTRDVQVLGIFADHLRDDSNAAIQAYGEFIAIETELFDTMDCGHVIRSVECRRCLLLAAIRDMAVFSCWPKPRGVRRRHIEQLRGSNAYDWDEFKMADRTFDMSPAPVTWGRLAVRLGAVWAFRRGIPAVLRCSGPDVISLWPWLLANVALERVELTTAPPLGVDMYHDTVRLGSREVLVEIPGIEGAFARIAETGTTYLSGGSTIGGFTNAYLIESCMTAAAPWLDVEIGMDAVGGGQQWSIMNFVRAGRGRTFLEYQPLLVDAGHERLYAHYL